MVSVNEKYFIENLASETAPKSHTPKKVVTPVVSSPPQANSYCGAPLNSVGYKYELSEDSWKQQGFCGEFNSEDKWTNRNAGQFTPSNSGISVPSDPSNVMQPKKKFVWDHQMISNINNILSKSDLDSSTGSSNSEKKSSSFSNFHVSTYKTIPRYSETPDDSLQWDSPTLSRDRSQECKFNKKPFYSRYDNKEIYKRSKVKNFSIQPLDANWKYGNVDYEEILGKLKERMIRLKDWVRIHQPKLSLIGDSHTRNLEDILSEMLPGFKIEASVKPGAKSKRVLSSLKYVLPKMTENDFLVTLSGTNDMWSESLDEPKSVVFNAVTDSRCTNLLLCNVPNNYLEPTDSQVQNNISNFNQFYLDVVNFSKYAHLVDLFQLKNRCFFTRHGLHFNLYGKIKICDLVSNKILDIIDLIKA